MRGLVLVLMWNVCYLAVILFSWWLLDGYCSLLLVTWWLLVVTACYLSLLLVPTFSMNVTPGQIQRSPDRSSTIWEPLNKKGLHFLHRNVNSLLSKKDEIGWIANKTKAAVVGMTESKCDHSVPDSEVNFPGYDILQCDINRNGSGVACYIRKDLCFTTRALHTIKLKILFLTFFYLS